MSYKNTLQEHNTKLQQAIDKANSLPDAGGGSGSYETCTLRFVRTDDTAYISDLFFMTLNEDGSLYPNAHYSPYSEFDGNEVVYQGVVTDIPIVCYLDGSAEGELVSMTNAKEVKGVGFEDGTDYTSQYLFFECTTPGGETVIVHKNASHWGGSI